MTSTESIRQMIVEARADIASLETKFDLPDDVQRTCEDFLAQLDEFDLQLESAN
jgi:hypothetical protein